MYSKTKRLFDLFFSSCAILVVSPIFVLIILLIKLTSKGPVFYKSQRIGKNFKPIDCWKFRTMYVDADQKLRKLLAQNPKLKEEWQLYQKLKEDPRIYPVGRLLRKTSMDELPQFFNVLKGDLSVVGPRPFYQEQITQYLGQKASKFLSIPPGITGIWQVSGRNLLTFDQRLSLEEDYIDRQSFILDLIIILKTIPVLFCAKGAY